MVHVPWVLRKYVYSVVGWCVLEMSVRSRWFTAFSKSVEILAKLLHGIAILAFICLAKWPEVTLN